MALSSAGGAELERRGYGRPTRWLLRQSPFAFAVGVVAIALLKYGIGIYPAWKDMLELAQNWRHPLVAQAFVTFVRARFYLDSSTAAVLAGMLHLTSARQYLYFQFLLACGAIMVPFTLRPVRRSPELRLSVALLLVGGAVPAELLSWVGSYDPVSLGSAAVAGLTSNPVVRALAWMVFAFNNASEAGVALIIFAIVLLADGGRAALARIISSGIGSVVGYVAIRVLTAAWGGGQSQFTLMRSYGIHLLLGGYGNLPLVALSALGVGWLFLIHPDVRTLAAAKTLLAVSVLAVFAIPLLAIDTSRTIAAILWPALLATAAIVVSRLDLERVRGVLAWVLPVALILVIVLALGTKVIYAGWG